MGMNDVKSFLNFSYLSAQISVANSITDNAYDGIVYIAHSLSETGKYEVLKPLLPSIIAYSEVIMKHYFCEYHFTKFQFHYF